MKTVAALLAFLLSLSGCSPKPEPILDRATVVAGRASVRLKNSSTSRTLRTLETGEKVDVLARQDNWYRIRYGDGLVGWMEESTVVTNATMARIHEMAAASQTQPAQNTAVVRETANFRIEPGRSTPVIRRLEADTRVDVLERVTTARPGSNGAHDVWIKVRPAPTEVGWVFASLAEFDVPADIAPYTEGYTYTAVKTINQVQDSIAGPINWYVVSERTPGLDPDLDFDGIRVFTWNLSKHRYETAFRTRGLRGVYPLETSQEGANPAFHFFQLSEDGKKQRRDFVMNGVIVREVKRVS